MDVENCSLDLKFGVIDTIFGGEIQRKMSHVVEDTESNEFLNHSESSPLTQQSSALDSSYCTTSGYTGSAIPCLRFDS